MEHDVRRRHDACNPIAISGEGHQAHPITHGPANDGAAAFRRREKDEMQTGKLLQQPRPVDDQKIAPFARIRPTDAQKTDADRLRADIQRQLLALTATPSATEAAEPGDGRVP